MTLADTKRWATVQRKLYRAGRLGTNKAKLLEKIPGWSWEKVRTVRSIKEWVSFAESLAEKQKDKTLPCRRVLEVKLKLFTFSALLRKQPIYFAHIPQHHKLLSDRQHLEGLVLIAEKLAAKQSDKLLPRLCRLSSVLCSALQRHKSDFAHIPQRKGHRTLKEWVAVAKQIAAKQKDKMLPRRANLGDGMSGLARAMLKNPEAFARIPQHAGWKRPRKKRKLKWKI